MTENVDGLQHKGTVSTIPVFGKLEKYKSVCLIMWTYDISAFDNGTY